MSDGGKGSKPRPFSVDHEKYIENWNRVFSKRLKEVEDMARVSGVPYEVELPEDCYQEEQDAIATLEQENKYMRARMERLEEDNRSLEEVIHKLNMELRDLKGQGQ